jgi:glycine/D-amino acid oxidase-like deaminating enzyme/nitrite reductase/ring-hydroxylating ferredoxin subunit
MSAYLNDNLSENTKPLWIDTTSVQRYEPLQKSFHADVCIIGGGITGLTAAHLLKQAGKSVAVVELSRIGYGETGHTTAHVTEVLDIGYGELISNFGFEAARLATQSCRTAIQFIEGQVRELKIDCGFARLPAYKYAERKEDIAKLEAEAESATKLGVPHTLTYEVPLPFEVHRAIRFEHQAQFHPMRYLSALGQTIPGDGSAIFENTRVHDIEESHVRQVHTDRGTIFARDVIVAANVPILNRFLMQTKIAAYRTYAIAARVRNSWDKDYLFWDTADPYHYIRREHINGIDYLIVGGQDHKTGQEAHTDISYQKLEDYARERFEIESVPYRWSGQIIEPVDGLPFIGRNSMSQHIFVSTGYSGTGMTFGTIGGMLTSDLILGKANPWEKLYDAKRMKPLASVKNFISENVDFPSHLISDRFSSPSAESKEDLIRENEGRIVRTEGKRVAAYRDPEGRMHYMSPVCPHMGCYVGWNQAEKSWDCPCHGSRFNPVGKVLNGPAVEDLANETFDGDLPLIPEPYDEKNISASDAISSPLLSFFTCPLHNKP